MAYNQMGMNGPAEWAQNQQNQQQEQWQNIMQLMMAAQQEKRRQEQQVFQNTMEQGRLGEEQKRTGMEAQNYASEDAERKSLDKYRQEAAGQAKGQLAQRHAYAVSRTDWTPEEQHQFEESGQSPDRYDVAPDYAAKIEQKLGLQAGSFKATSPEGRRGMQAAYEKMIEAGPALAARADALKAAKDKSKLGRQFGIVNRALALTKSNMDKLPSKYKFVKSTLDLGYQGDVDKMRKESPEMAAQLDAMQNEQNGLNNQYGTLGRYYELLGQGTPLEGDDEKYIGNLFAPQGAQQTAAPQQSFLKTATDAKGNKVGWNGQAWIPITNQ